MDPNAALKTLREQAKGLTRDSDYADAHDVQGMVEQFEALDGWLSKGGFAPVEWGGPTGVVDPHREVPADEVKALVAIEATERLVKRALRELSTADRKPDLKWVRMLLEAATDVTTTRTVTAIKSQYLSDEVSLAADLVVAQEVKKARAEQAAQRESSLHGGKMA